MTLAVRAVFWVIAYLGAVLSPLVFAVIGTGRPDHDIRHGVREVPVRHVQMTRLVWLITALIVLACIVFAAAQTG